MATNRDTAPRFITDDADLSNGTSCAICNLPVKVVDGPAVHFEFPSRTICGHCISAIKAGS